MDLSRYRNPALQCSFGKDSLACLYMLADQLERITVYWVNTGDGCPETLDIVQAVRPMIPKFVEIRTDVHAWRAENGLPSDVVPANGTLLGLAYGMGKTRIACRFDCCIQNLMKPMHDRMLADGVDAVIRGTKLSDTGKVPAEGPTGFYDVLLPLRDWTHDEVFTYLRQVGAPINPIYQHFKSISAPECFGCTAWWGDGKAEYLKARHPGAYKEYQLKLQRIAESVTPHARDFAMEMGS